MRLSVNEQKEMGSQNPFVEDVWRISKAIQKTIKNLPLQIKHVCAEKSCQTRPEQTGPMKIS